MRRLSYGSVLVALILVASTGGGGEKIPPDALAALQEGEKFELYSLHPAKATEPPPNNFHGWEVLGSTTIEKAEVRGKLITALKKGAEASDGAVAACFNPRHGIRAVHAGKTYDLAICFECLQVAVYVDDKRQAGFLVTDSPQPTFDNVLKDAKVKLAEKEE